MTLYSELTVFALQTGEIDPVKAWEAGKKMASQANRGAESSLNKGCPKNTFIGLAALGHVKGLNRGGMGNENSAHALAAHKLLVENPDFRNNKAAWWRAVKKHSGTDRDNHNSVMDVLLALIDEGRFET